MPPPNSGALPKGARYVNNHTLQASTAQSSTGNNQSTPTVGIGDYSAASVFLTCTAITASTVNVWIQKKLPDDTTWQDIAAFDQLTAVGSRTIEIVSAGNAQHTPVNGSLSAGTVLTANLGNEWAIAYSVGNAGGGTATFAVFADFSE